MTIDKNYFLNRLANGEDMDAIGNELAAMMTDALNEHMAIQEAKAAEAALAEKELAKRDLVAEMVDIVRELAILEGFDESDIEVTDEGINEMTAMLSAMFQLAKAEVALMAMKSDAAPAIKPAVAKSQAAKSDEAIILDFLKSLT